MPDPIQAHFFISLFFFFPMSETRVLPMSECRCGDQMVIYIYIYSSTVWHIILHVGIVYLNISPPQHIHYTYLHF